ncbi:MAG: hypothetical protein ABIE94_05660 [archaeon]
MSLMAVDIVLLPPEEVMDVCIDIHKKAAKTYSGLNKKDYFSHISLVMAVVDEKDLPKINLMLEEVSKEFSSMDFEITGIHGFDTGFNHTSWSFEMKLTPEVKKLHIELMNGIKPFHIPKKTEQEMFYRDPGETINELSSSWVDNYQNNHTEPDKFFPHISLNCDKPTYDELPIRFTASKLAMFQLGNFCTCRKILFSTELKLDRSI